MTQKDLDRIINKIIRYICHAFCICREDAKDVVGDALEYACVKLPESAIVDPKRLYTYLNQCVRNIF